MAKFHSYYVLCPLIDQNSFLGVNKDKENEHVLITLGRNVVNKYRLSDQKQICGWTSKDHITSAVVYDEEQGSYIGIFNKNTIKAWKDEGECLDKLKKYKFSANIIKVLPRQKLTSLIIFENGNCAALPYGVENRKTYENKLFIKESEIIVDVDSYNIDSKEHICYLLKSKSVKKEKYEILTCPIRDELGDLEKAKLHREKVMRSDDVYVVGHLLSTADNYNIYFLWSDSKISVYDVQSKSWKNIVSVPWISTLSSVSLAWMGDNHLILFGSNTEEDGAILLAYNVALGVGSCRYPMKMYTKDAKLYCFNNRIVLQGTNHIAMIPYVLVTDRNLSSLLASHDVISENAMEIVNWGSPVEPLFFVGNEMKDLCFKGLTERNICAQIIPSLIEKDDFRDIFNTIKQFSDIPESILVLLLNYAIKLVNPDNTDITDEVQFRELCSCKNYQGTALEIQMGKFDLLKCLLQITFSDALITPYIRSGLTLDNALFLLSFIAYLIKETDVNIVHESKLYDWCMLLMDTFYQQYLVTKDLKVTYVLKKMQKLVDSLIDNLNSISTVLPALDKLICGTSIPEHKAPSSYTIELLNI